MSSTDGRGGYDEPTPARPATVPQPWNRRPGGVPDPAAGLDHGAVTAEFALALPFFVLLLTALLAAVVAGITHLQCLDAARSGARAAARHDDPRSPAASAAPAGADIGVLTAGDQVTVQVTVELKLPLPWQPRLRVRAESTSWVEPQVRP